MTPTPLTAVFDCNVLVQVVLSRRGAAAGCFDLVKGGKAALVVSAAVVEELTDVLNRPKLRKKFRSLVPEVIGAFLRELQAKAVLRNDVPQVWTSTRDPDDEHYVNLAVAGGCRFLVSRDNDLLDLMDESTPEGKDFRARFPSLTILDPAAFLRASEVASPVPPAEREA
jgi:putative PIN family toxin of toxin-antitoxin system